MEVLNLVDIFKNYIENIAPEEDKILFEDIFLGKKFSSDAVIDNKLLYTKEEYFNQLRNILSTQGQGYSYGEFGLYERTPSSIRDEYSLRSNTLQKVKFQKTIIYPYEPSPAYMRNLKDFNSFIFNPVFSFVFLPKIYDSPNFQHVFAEISRGELDRMLERWRDYFLPFIKDYCSYYHFIAVSNKFLVYKNKNNIVVSSSFLKTTAEKKFNLKLDCNLKYIYNYE